MKELLKSGITGFNREEYQEFLMKWDWEWFLTARLHSRTIFKDPSTYLRDFCIKILRQHGGQIGSMGIFVNGDTGAHIHAVLLGRFPHGRTLRDIDEKLWVMPMSKITGKSCEISRVDDKKNRVNYIANWKNTPAGHHEWLVPWGRILKKTQLAA